MIGLKGKETKEDHADNMPKQQGKFIVFEGIDKSGKSTQVKLLAGFLLKQGIKVWLTFEPTDNWLWGRIIRFILKRRLWVPALWLQYMYFLDRRKHIKIIKKHLWSGEWVICDRYFFSTLAYGYSGDVKYEKILKWHKKILKPDIVILVDISAEEAIHRLIVEGSRAELFEKEDRLKKVKAGYQKCLGLFPGLIKVINGQQSQQEVFDEIKKTINLKL